MKETQIFLWNAKLCKNIFWTVDFECPSPWWLVMYARYAVCVCGYSTGPPRDYKAYCCGGPGSPQFSTGAPKHEKLRFFCQN